MQQYLDLMRRVLEEGQLRSDRTGTGTLSLFGEQCRYDLQAGLPLLTTKKVHFRSIAYELIWFLRGDTNVRWLQENKVSIWDEWADEDGELGPVYGKQWRRWEHADGSYTDQMLELIRGLTTEPHSRRHILSSWNVGQLPEMALPPCHMLAQFYVAGDKLSCQLYQRSADLFLGVPFNIASYALLTCMLAQVCDLKPGEFVHSFGDVHLYANHLEQARQQLSRQPRSLPTLHIRPPERRMSEQAALPLGNGNTERTAQDRLAELLAIGYEDLELLGYDPHPHIAAKVAV